MLEEGTVTRKMLESQAEQWISEAEGNIITSEVAISRRMVGLQLFDAPLIGVADAHDPLFESFKNPEVIGQGYLLPTEWMPEAERVVSFFLPFTERVRKSNRHGSNPSDEWLHARIEGQDLIETFNTAMQQLVHNAGFQTLQPTKDPRYALWEPYHSNWSERHAAFAAGLGTFGLSKGLITQKGVAGRFCSFLTTAPLEITPRPYKSPFEYCTMCGVCAHNCPADAIEPARGVALGKSHEICRPYTKRPQVSKTSPCKRERYGCGKCQVDVPCEARIPKH